MVNLRQPRDVAQILLSVLFLAIMIIACLWIVRPFVLGFAWAATVVVATWPLLLRLQKLLFGRRGLAVLVMTLLLFLLFIIPIALLVNSLVDSSGPVIRAITSGDMTLPDLAWLNSIPVVGAKLYSGWHSLLEMGGSALMAKVRPYIGTTTTWFVGQAAHIGRFMMHCTLMLVFSALLYWRGEQVALGYVISPPDWQVNAAMRPCCWQPRPSARWRSVWWSQRWCRLYLAESGWRFPAYLMPPFSPSSC